jgi:hypothetical protein
LLARKSVARLIGIHQGIGIRQRSAGQMMVGNQHPDAERMGGFYAFNAGHPVIHRNQQIRLLAGGNCDNLRGQAVAVNKAIGHHIVHLCRAQRPQRPRRQRTTGGAVGIEISHNRDAPPLT